MNYTELINRIEELKSRKGRGSISADETFSLLMELAEKTKAVDINAGSLTIRHMYTSVAAMNADNNPVDQETNKPLKFGQLVCVCNSNDITQSDNGKIYRYNKPGWEFLRQVGDMVQFAKKEDIDDKIVQVEQNAVYSSLSAGMINLPLLPLMDNHYYDSTNGNISTSSNYICSVKFLIIAGTTLKSTSITGTPIKLRRILRWREDGTFIDSTTQDAASSITVADNTIVAINIHKPEFELQECYLAAYNNLNKTDRLNSVVVDSAVETVLNLDTKKPLLEGFYTKKTARSAVLSVERKRGMILTYRDGTPRNWVTQIYNGNSNNAPDETWLSDDYWTDIITGKELPRIIEKNLLFPVIGKNKFDKDAILSGFYIDRVTGLSASAPTGFTLVASGFITVTEGETYHFGNTGSTVVVGYPWRSTAVNPIKLQADRHNYDVDTLPLITIPVGSGIRYIRFNIDKQYLDTLQIEIGTEGTNYKLYEVKEEDIKYSVSLTRPNNIGREGDVLSITKRGVEWVSKLPGIKWAILGDSAVTLPSRWVEKVADKLRIADYRNFGIGGYTWATRYDESSNLKTCILIQINNLLAAKASGWIPDMILIQAGGNDIWLSEEKLGSLETVFTNSGRATSYNWKNIDNTTTYGGLRYNLQLLIEEFPNTKIIVGTPFQRRGNDALKIANPIKEVCRLLNLTVIDGNKESGISMWLECSPEHLYCDSETPSRYYPQYNWVEPDGTISRVEEKKMNTIKKYGKYTYDGTHQNEDGENLITNYMMPILKMYMIKRG